MTVEMKSMEGKKIPTSATAKDKGATQKTAQVVHFVGDIKGELKRITWTSKEELWVYTKIVVAATVILGLGIYFVDVIIQTLLEGLSTIMRFLGA